VLLRELGRLRVPVSVWDGGPDVDVLVVGQTQNYRSTAAALRSFRSRGGAIVLDVTNDVFSARSSYAERVRYQGAARLLWRAKGLRLRLQATLGIGNWGHARKFWDQIDAVVAGSRLQSEKYARLVEHRYELVDPVDPVEYHARATCVDRHPVMLVWEGSRDNLVYLIPYLDAFKELEAERIATLRIITDDARSAPVYGVSTNRGLLARLGLTAEFVDWSLEGFSISLAEGDIGIAPLPLDDPFCVAKPSNKILGYAYLGLPVIASPIPSYRRVIEHAGFGVLAETAKDWVDSVKQLADDPERRRRMGQAGREYVARNHGPVAFAERYLQIIEECADTAAATPR
jgi:hypothetical protein